MLVTLTVIRYKKRFIPFALLAMAVHHIPLLLNTAISFHKLLGCGKNGSFDKHPDWQQWAILAAHTPQQKKDIINNNLLIRDLYGSFIGAWVKLFNCEICTFYLEPTEGHGKWNGKFVFGNLPAQSVYDGTIAVLTRATIRLSRLSAFWNHVDAVAVRMRAAKGFITSIGIGETPYTRQATFSIWQDKESMKTFAYQMKEHTDVIKKTRKENWYSEDMFVRFKVLKIAGTISGVNPLEGIL